jgi:methylmalonyl-CoA mutase cobalamin-binding subunit
MEEMNPKKIVAASIGSCIHVAGVINFCDIAEKVGYETRFLGSVSVEELVQAVLEYDPDIVGVSYRLTPKNVEILLHELKTKIDALALSDKRWVFGGTVPVAAVAKKSQIFEAVFTGLTTMEDTIAYLKRESKPSKKGYYPQTVMERVILKKPFPLIRHHFGLPDFEETVQGIKEIAEAKVLDVISIAPDQNTQESFFRPDEMTKEDGSGGVPLRKRKDFVQLYQASRCGNYPLLRCYSGTRDLIHMSHLLFDTLNNAWSATPLTWYSVLDGRSSRFLREAIVENQQNMQWNAQKGIPVEVNEAHQWSLRNAHDTLAVVMAYLAALNAKKMGVCTYIAQYMFNTPLGTSPVMDLAKMLAKIELIESLHDHHFTSLRQVRVAGLLSYPVDPDYAKAQLASSVYTGMGIAPHIVHAVSYSEADHAATPEDVIKTCKIAKGVIQNWFMGVPDMHLDPRVVQRKQNLLREARVLLDAIQYLGKDSPDPFIDPDVLVKAVKTGLLDAPQLRGNAVAKGEIKTKMINGACYVVDKGVITEEERVQHILEDVMCEN